MVLDEITRDELQGVIAHLKEARYNHQQWHEALVRVIACKLPSNKNDTDTAAHTKCLFGQWYYGHAATKLRKHPGFIAMGDEHQRMHHFARQLLVAASDGKPLDVNDFDKFGSALTRLRLEISALEKELEDALHNHDSLTGAVTRYGILPTLREQHELVKRHVQFCCIAMMDMDNFKAVNDLHGHPAGDRVLTASVQYLMKHLRSYDKVFRYGGEEFLLSMPYPADLTPDYERKVNNLREGISSLNIDIGRSEPIHITASFGLTILDPDTPVETTIDRVDKALYAAKAAGRNCVQIWNPSM
jgi:diguanylate cyclase